VGRLSSIVMSTATDLRALRLTVDQVHAMIAAGILPEGPHTELIDGLLVYKDRSEQGEDPMTSGKRHNLAVKLRARLDAELTAHGCHMQTQGPVSRLRTASLSPMALSSRETRASTRTACRWPPTSSA
jgi:hypothetical protein